MSDNIQITSFCVLLHFQHTSTHSKNLPLYNIDTANSSVQTDNKKNSVPQSVSQSVQTDNEKNSVPQTVTQSVQAHDEEWQEVCIVTVDANKNKHHNVTVKKPEEEFFVPTSNRFAALSEENDIPTNIYVHPFEHTCMEMHVHFSDALVTSFQSS